jgi:hypothetical protein
MHSGNFMQAYQRAEREKPAAEFIAGRRPEPTLDEARDELAEAITRILDSLLNDRYGPLFGKIGQPAVTEFLKGWENTLSRAKGDFTLLTQELLDRAIPPRSRKRK